MPAGQHKNAAPSGAQSAEKSALFALPAHHPPLLIVTRMGRDYRPGPRQRIERVAAGQRTFLNACSLTSTDDQALGAAFLNGIEQHRALLLSWNFGGHLNGYAENALFLWRQ